jgi:hypothetical protein
MLWHRKGIRQSFSNTPRDKRDKKPNFLRRGRAWAKARKTIAGLSPLTLWAVL